MLRKALKCGGLGFILGVFISYTISILVSLVWTNGYYSPVVPSIIQIAKNEINAVILQFLLSGTLGIAFASASIIWEFDNWSVLKQTFVHFCVSTLVMLPIAYICNWMEHSIWGLISYLLIFVIIYIIVWFIQYNVWKRKIQIINSKIQN